MINRIAGKVTPPTLKEFSFAKAYVTPLTNAGLNTRVSFGVMIPGKNRPGSSSTGSTCLAVCRRPDYAALIVDSLRSYEERND